MRSSAAVLVAATFPLLTLTGTANAAPAPEPQRISGANPFTDCTPGAIDGKMADGAIEPQLAVDPHDARRLAAVWPQDRQRGVVLAVSRDGGSNWQRTVVPNLTRCSGGSHDHVDGPAVTFTGDGGLVVTGGLFMADGSASAAVSTRSEDGGRTWTRPAVIVAATEPAQGGVGGGAPVVDPRDPDVLYVVTPRFPAEARTRNDGWISRSADGGRSWQPPTLVVDAGDGHLVSGHRLTVLDDGTLVDVHSRVRFGEGPITNRLTLQAVRSTDGGRTWSTPVKVADQRTKWLFQDPESGEQVSHTTSLLSDTAVDRRTGRIHVAWQDARFSGGGADAVALASSDDGGRTWSEPVKVNRTPTDIPMPNQQAFTVALAVGRGGTVAVSYSDFRRNDTGAPLLTDRWLVRCSPQAADCASKGATWRETRLTPISFDMRQAPRIPDEASPRGYFLGEQTGLIANRSGFAAAWAAPDEPGSAAVHAVTVR
ncbi:sialidase family protein [Streptomyces sp. GESEQ-35]|uniref:sialidase family protein n=1 Tax=Streptomyces sp. GESEQ-35 TaxID=2812657 RepID=UPI001B339794|nr:sialidase family protein [Streptomyces sp. GESEQ-35]